MGLGKTKDILDFQDQAVIYYSDDDKCWIAHSLNLDQIGTGKEMVDALADLIRGVRKILKMAGEDESIAFLRKAPDEIRAMVRTCKPLPREIFEVAYRRETGDWPADWSLPEPKNHSRFQTTIPKDLDKKMKTGAC